MEFFSNRKINKLLTLILFVIVFLFSANILHKVAYSDEYDDLTKKIADLQKSLEDSQKATKPLQTQLTGLKTQLNGIDMQVKQIEQDLVTKKKNIDEGYKRLIDKQKLFNATVKNSYIKTYTFSPLLIFLSGNDITDITSMLTYQKRNTQQDKNIITNIALQLVDLEQKKAKLEDEQNRLAVAKISLDKQRAEVQKVVEGAVAFQNTLTGQITALSARQREILNQRLSSLNIPLFAYSTQGGCSSDIGKSPGFSNAMGFFTYGVPNRVGLNQYGAFGRSKTGQSFDTILRAYYNFDSIENRSATINVEGYGGYSLDDYVKRIYEVPNEWGSQGGMEALKAQAIAARSYAMAYTNNGSGSICTTQQCQVFKPDPKGGNWEQAVNDTSGQVMVKGGNAIKAWFSSTHGGYIHSSGDIGWSSTDWTKNSVDASGSVGSFSDLKSNAYDKDSPWFYCDWGSRSQNNGTAWLKPDEVADIVNVILLGRADSSTGKHLYQTDKPNPEGTDNWDAPRVRQELSSRGISGYNSVSDVSVSVDFGSGKTSSVNVSGDGGSQNISGDEFKNWFNLRAPANIQIVGSLFNAEKG
jgi:peptidoglycan hydrolase-like amidase